MKFIFVAIGLLILAGCQTMPYQGQARDVKLKPQKEGVIALPPTPRDEDRAKAQLKMKQNCAPYESSVLEEGEVAVGQKTDSAGSETDRASTKHKMGSVLGMALIGGREGGRDVSSSTTTTDIKEWHISYKCDAKTVKR